MTLHIERVVAAWAACLHAPDDAHNVRVLGFRLAKSKAWHAVNEWALLWLLGRPPSLDDAQLNTLSAFNHAWALIGEAPVLARTVVGPLVQRALDSDAPLTLHALDVACAMVNGGHIAHLPPACLFSFRRYERSGQLIGDEAATIQFAIRHIGAAGSPHYPNARRLLMYANEALAELGDITSGDAAPVREYMERCRDLAAALVDGGTDATA